MIVSKKMAIKSISVLFVAFGVFFLFFAYAFFQTGAVRQSWLYLDGVRVFPNKSSFDLGETKAEESQNFNVIIRNLGDDDISVVGSQVSCNCTQITNLPIRIPASGSSEVCVCFSTPKKTGQFNVRVTLYLQEKHSISTILFSINGFSREF